MTRYRHIRIGVIADTHGLFDTAIERSFAGVDHIIHAGDIGHRSVIERLSAIAPVIAVSGNVDENEANGFPCEAVIELGGLRIAVHHILYQSGKLTKEGQVFLERVQPDICIFGHTHRPTIEYLGDILLVNPGSAGPKRFSLPRSLGLLSVGNGRVLPRLLALSARTGPGQSTPPKRHFCGRA